MDSKRVQILTHFDLHIIVLRSETKVLLYALSYSREYLNGN